MQRYTIRDLNTGQLYVLDGDEGIASPDDRGSPASGRVTDIIQGRQLSLDEFEQLLGLNAVLEVPFTLKNLGVDFLHQFAFQGDPASALFNAASALIRCVSLTVPLHPTLVTVVVH